MEDLPLQVGCIDAIAIGQHQRADAGRSQVQRRRRTESAGADHQRPRGEQSLLSGDVDFRQQDVAAVAEELRVVHANGIVCGD